MAVGGLASFNFSRLTTFEGQPSLHDSVETVEIEKQSADISNPSWPLPLLGRPV